tara:strand:- start:601 stop:1149 length:549 start_codon:yes stop_codon:yes gene_type:complete
MKKRLLFLGPPGAGKGTQASLLCKNNDFLHLSTGDLLRSEVEAGTDLGKQAEIVMNKGELVSDQIVLALVEKKLTEQARGWLLDGFPRNLSQAESLESLLFRIDQPIEAVVLIAINDEILVERLLARGRDDDNEKVIRNRLEVYRNKTAPLIDHYFSRGLLKSVEGDAGIDVVASRIRESLN